MTECNLVKSTVTQYLPSYHHQNLSKRGVAFSESLEQKEDDNLTIASQESSEVTRVPQKDSPLNMDAEEVQFHPLGELVRVVCPQMRLTTALHNFCYCIRYSL